MIFADVKNEQGFGFVQILAALIIVSVAVGGIFISTIYAKAKVIENNHHRKAMLAAAGKLNMIKYYNRNNQGETNIGDLLVINGLYDDVLLDDTDNNEIWGDVSISKQTSNELQIAPYVVYDKVIVEISWQETSPLEFPDNAKEKTIRLREDYYRKMQ